MNSFRNFCFIRVFVFSRPGGILQLNSLSMYNVGDHSHSPDLFETYEFSCITSLCYMKFISEFLLLDGIL